MDGDDDLWLSRFVISRCLNHVDRTVTGRYDVHEYYDEKKDTLDRLGSASEKSTEDGQDLEAKNSDNREPRNKPGRPRSKRVLAEGAIRALYPEGGCDGEKLEMLWSLVNEHIAPETVGRETVRRAKEGILAVM